MRGKLLSGLLFFLFRKLVSASRLSDFQMIAQIRSSVFQITRCRVVNQLPVLGKAGTVTGAIPGVLQRIPFKRAAQMGTAFGGGRQQTDHSLKPVDGQLGVKNGTGG